MKVLNISAFTNKKDALQVRRGDVLSAWAGIRPLVQDPDKQDTQSIARNHIVHVTEDGLVTIAGGKWTTYRSMAVDALDAAIQSIVYIYIYKTNHVYLILCFLSFIFSLSLCDKEVPHNFFSLNIL